MAIYEITPDQFRRIAETSFGSQSLTERQHLQRLLRTQIETISPDTLIIAEEFGNWDDSKRRIDLLGVDKNANLVVIELKRTADGGHMDLQALRYAAMVSAMTFDQAVDVYSQFLMQLQSDLDPRSSLLEFLEWDEPDEDRFAQEVRIVLASADFSKELTTAVIWLNGCGLNIRCIRMKPYADNGRVFADVQQIIPLPEAEAYQVQLKEKQTKEREARKFNPDFTKYDVTVVGEAFRRLPKRGAIFEVVRYLCKRGIAPETIAQKVPWRRNSMFREVDGCLTSAEFIAAQKVLSTTNGKRFEQKRFYCDVDELLYNGSQTYAFTNQWGNRCLEAIERLIAAFPDEQITCTPSPLLDDE